MLPLLRVLAVLVVLATVFAQPRSFRPHDNEGDEEESRRDRQGDVRSIPDWGKKLGGKAADWGKRIAAAAHSRRRKPAIDTRARDRLKRQEAIGVQRRDRRGEKRDKPKPKPKPAPSDDDSIPQSDDDSHKPKPKPKPKPAPSDDESIPQSDDDSVPKPKPKPKPKPVPSDDDTIPQSDDESVPKPKPKPKPVPSDDDDSAPKLKRDGLHNWFRRTSKGIKRDAMRGPRDGKDHGRGGDMSKAKRRPKNGSKRGSREREEGREDRRSRGRDGPPSHKSSLSAVDVLHAVVQPKEKK